MLADVKPLQHPSGLCFASLEMKADDNGGYRVTRDLYVKAVAFSDENEKAIFGAWMSPI